MNICRWLTDKKHILNCLLPVNVLMFRAFQNVAQRISEYGKEHTKTLTLTVADRQTHQNRQTVVEIHQNSLETGINTPKQTYYGRNMTKRTFKLIETHQRRLQMSETHENRLQTGKNTPK